MKKILLFILLIDFCMADKISVISVPKMHCPLCTTAVKKAIKSVDGIKNVSVRLNTKKATVVYDNSLDIKTILDAIKSTSYEGVLVSTEDK